MAYLQVFTLVTVLIIGASSQSDIRMPPKFKTPLGTTNLYFSENANVVVECSADGIPQPTYRWLQNGTVVVPTAYITFDSTTGELKIPTFSVREEATYTCIASNVFSNGQGGQITAANWSPRVRIYQSRIEKFDEPTPVDLRATEYNYMYMPCTNKKAVVGSTIIYNWYETERKGIQMEDGRLFIDQTGTLHFTYVLARDGQVLSYYCGISTDNEQIIRLGTKNTLAVTASSSTVALSPVKQYTNTGIKGLLFKSVKLECVFSGYDPTPPYIPVISWVDDANKPIVPSEKYSISGGGRILTISKLLEDDEKVYTCKAKNSAGETLAPVLLNVTSGPIFVTNGAPVDQIVPENTDVVFRCDTRSASKESPPGIPLWAINGINMGPQNDPNKFQLSDGNKVLTIKNVKKATDILCVKCEVSNDVDSVLANACLNVILAITIETQPKLPLEIRKGENIDLTVTAKTDPSMTLSYRWEFNNKSYVGSNAPPHMFYNPLTMLAYINTSGLSEDEYVAIGGVYRRVIYHLYQTVNVDIEVILADRTENTTPSFVETTPVVGSTPAASNGTTSVAGSTPAATNGTTPVAGSTPAASNGTTPVATPSSIRYDFDCFLTSMDVFIPVHLAPNSELTMKDKFCPLRNNGTHYVITFSYNECGTSQTTYSNNQLLVENAITVHVTLNKSGPVEFAPDYTIPLQCTINLNNSVHGAFQAVDRDFYTEKNAQSSDFEMKEFRSALYEDEITQYPVKVPLNRELFFELGLINVRRNGSGIRVDKCEATPTNNPNFLNRFLLITSGCSSSPAVKVLPRPGQDRFRFSIHAFHFSAPVNQNNLVYIHCYVNICQPNRCDSVCPQSKRRRRSSRNVRSVTLTSGIHIITA